MPFIFAHDLGRPYQRDEVWLRFFATIADRVVSDIRPCTALDAGCAVGFLVEALRDQEVNAVGVDISEYTVQQVRPDVRPSCWVGSVIDPLPQKYDFIVCIEVLKHLASSEAEQAVANFCQHPDDVLFSSTPFDYKEVTHLNVRPSDYWAELFARYGFFSKGCDRPDAEEDLTPLEHFLEDYRDKLTTDTRPTEGVPGGRMGHYHTFTPDPLLEVMEWMKNAGLGAWELIVREECGYEGGQRLYAGVPGSSLSKERCTPPKLKIDRLIGGPLC